MTDKKTSVSRRSFLKGSLAAGSIKCTSVWDPALCGGHASVTIQQTKQPLRSALTSTNRSIRRRGRGRITCIQAAVSMSMVRAIGGMMQTMKPMNLKGNGILGKK